MWSKVRVCSDQLIFLKEGQNVSKSQEYMCVTCDQIQSGNVFFPDEKRDERSIKSIQVVSEKEQTLSRRGPKVERRRK